MAPRKTALYRAFAADGPPIYIGISSNWGLRWQQHAAACPWFYDVVRLEVQWFPTKADALVAEAEAIRAERPKYNWTHLRTAKREAS